MGDLMNRSFRFDSTRSFSFDANKFTKSNTSRLTSEIGSSQSARFTTYEKLSDSMRLADVVESKTSHGSRSSRKGAWKFVTKVFSLKKAGGDSSYTRQPDLNRRWPVQGW